MAGPEDWGATPVETPSGPALWGAVSADKPADTSSYLGELTKTGGSALSAMNTGLNPWSEENRKLSEESSKGWIEGAGADWQKKKNMLSGVAAIPQLIASPVTAAARYYGGHGLQHLDEGMRAGAVKLHGGEEGIPPAKTYEESADTAESMLGGIAPRGFTARGPIPRPAPQAPAPSVEELHEAASQAYRNARGLGVEIRRQPVARLADDIFSDLHNDGFRARNVPKTWDAIDELRSPAGQHATIDDLESVRKALNKAASNPMEGAEREAARRAISSLDDYLAGLDPAHVAVNPQFASRVAEEMQNARGNWGAMRRAETIENKEELAIDRAASTGSGANVNNAMRQKIREILASPKQRRGFSDEEIAQMRRVVRGTRTGNIARLIGKLAPTGVVSALPSVAAAGAAGFSPLAAAVPAVGFAGKIVGDASTARQLAQLNRMIRQRSPLARATTPAASAPLGPPSPAYPALTGLPDISRLPFHPGQLGQLQGTLPAGANEQNQKRNGGRANQPNGGIDNQHGLARGGAVRKGPPIPGARKAKDGHWYVKDHTRGPNKYLKWVE